ncbi:MAG TPA: PqqD family protein [Acidimicrobiales bacterium]|jgi:hypothetical protein
MEPTTADRPARADGLEVNDVSDGLVLYQQDPERVHYLNNTASLVFELCDGRRSPDEIATLLREAFTLERLPIEEVASCIDELRGQGVIR